MDVHCYLCSTAFENESKLQNHLENLEAFLKAFCKHCRSFIRFEESMLHLDITYSCTLCKLILSTQNFLDHKCLHEPSSQLLAMARREECGICEKLFFCGEDMDAHIRENHSSNGGNFCKCCKMPFKNKDSFLKHLVGHAKPVSAPPKTFPCESCDIEFKQNKSLLIHVRMVHKNEATKVNKPKNFSKDTKKKPKLVKKIVTKLKKAKGKIKNVCDVCNENFSSASILARHKSSHTKIKPFKCTKCAKTFRTQFLRDRHIRTHCRNKTK